MLVSPIMGKAVLAMAIVTLIIGGSAFALASYTFLFVFPNASSNMTNASAQMRTVANDVHDLANNLPCGNGCSVLGVEVLNFAAVKSTINTMGDTLLSLADSVPSFRDTLFFGLLTLMGVGLATVFAGMGLVLVERALKNVGAAKAAA